MKARCVFGQEEKDWLYERESEFNWRVRGDGYGRWRCTLWERSEIVGR